MSDDFNWKRDIRIDANNILKSMWEQTDIFGKYATQFANAESDKLSLQRQVSLLESKLELEIRANPADFGIEDVKEAAIKAVIQQNDEVKELHNRLTEVKKSLVVWKTAVTGCEHRRSMLKYMTELVTKNIFNVPDFIEQHKMERAKSKVSESQHTKELEEWNKKRK